MQGVAMKKIKVSAATFFCAFVVSGCGGGGGGNDGGGSLAEAAPSQQETVSPPQNTTAPLVDMAHTHWEELRECSQLVPQCTFIRFSFLVVAGGGVGVLDRYFDRLGGISGVLNPGISNPIQNQFAWSQSGNTLTFNFTQSNALQPIVQFNRVDLSPGPEQGTLSVLIDNQRTAIWRGCGADPKSLSSQMRLTCQVSGR